MERIDYITNRSMKKIILSLLLLIVFVPIEYHFSSQAYYTVGWLVNRLFMYVVWISILTGIAFLWLDFRKTAVVLFVSGFLIIVPFNMYYANVWHELKTQSDQIVHWAYQVKLKTGYFPDKPAFSCDSRITYSKNKKEDSFGIHFYISTPNTGHFYNSNEGWGYMDD